MTYLTKILEAHRAAATEDGRSLDRLIAQALAADEPRGFSKALRSRSSGSRSSGSRSPGSPSPGVAVISEIKRRSPSKGPLFAELDPTVVATAYAAGGASCLSVLTDTEFFGGSVLDLQTARAACDLPVIRKDFTVSANDVADARIMGADAVLLIVAALDDKELQDFHALAVELGLDALVETHDEAEVERALAVGATLIGVNQRDLVTFEVDTARAVRVAGVIPDTAVAVAESGITGPNDIPPLHAAGFDAVLVGEALVRSGDPAAGVAALLAAADS